MTKSRQAVEAPQLSLRRPSKQFLRCLDRAHRPGPAFLPRSIEKCENRYESWSEWADAPTICQPATVLLLAVLCIS